MPNLAIEFSEETLVLTDSGVERLGDLLRREVIPSLWAIKWNLRGRPNGVSFHKSHKAAKTFADLQLDSVPDGPARLVDVCPTIYKHVKDNGHCWTSLVSFEDAAKYEGKVWSR